MFIANCNVSPAQPVDAPKAASETVIDNSDASIMSDMQSASAIADGAVQPTQEDIDKSTETAAELLDVQAALDACLASCPGADSPDFQEWLRVYNDIQEDYKCTVNDILQYSGINPKFSTEVMTEINNQKAKLDGLSASRPDVNSPEYQEWLRVYNDAQEDYKYTVNDILSYYQAESLGVEDTEIDETPTQMASSLLSAKEQFNEFLATFSAGDPDNSQDWMKEYRHAYENYKSQVADIVKEAGIDPKFSTAVAVEIDEAKSNLDSILASCPGADSPDFQEWLRVYNDAQLDYDATVQDIFDFYKGESETV